MSDPLFLASASPRRKELLERAGIHLIIHVPQAEELAAPKTHKQVSPTQIVKRIAEAKALACIEELKNLGHKKAVVLAADTLVFAGERVLGKPRTKQEARKMLRFLSGKFHEVHTAVSIFVLEGKKLKRKTASYRTKVKFFPLSDELIRWYVATGEPMDKAGSYGAQGYGAALVETYQGSYTNVVGLPLGHTIRLLEKTTGRSWKQWQKRM